MLRKTEAAGATYKVAVLWSRKPVKRTATLEVAPEHQQFPDHPKKNHARHGLELNYYVHVGNTADAPQNRGGRGDLQSRGPLVLEARKRDRDFESRPGASAVPRPPQKEITHGTDWSLITTFT
ncbi:MAG: hypothetical protein JWL81_1977 [Verrucomicrobiales bacterium]|nr:hypothetical protein [Verrucomicrobiales bacterium]